MSVPARDIEAIRARIPLRYPYLMIDRVLEEGPDRVVALKNVSINEPFFQGHFPLEAVMPGTLILEAMAQACAFFQLTDNGEHAPRMGYLVGVDKFRVRRKVVPGDQLRIEARVSRRKRELVQADVEASVDGETAASATVSLVLKLD